MIFKLKNESGKPYYAQTSHDMVFELRRRGISNTLNELLESDDIVRMEVSLPEGFVSAIHMLSLTSGHEVDDGTYMYGKELRQTHVAKDSNGQYVINKIGDTPITVPSMFANLVGKSWHDSNGKMYPKKLSSFRKQLEGLLVNKVREWRGIYTASATVDGDAKLWWATMGEKAVRVIEGKGTDLDKKLFEMEAKIRGDITVDELVHLTYTKYRIHLTMGITFAALEKKAELHLNTVEDKYGALEQAVIDFIIYGDSLVNIKG